jgi:hypothetical protein
MEDAFGNLVGITGRKHEQYITGEQFFLKESYRLIQRFTEI